MIIRNGNSTVSDNSCSHHNADINSGNNTESHDYMHSRSSTTQSDIYGDNSNDAHERNSVNAFGSGFPALCGLLHQPGMADPRSAPCF